MKSLKIPLLLPYALAYLFGNGPLVASPERVSATYLGGSGNDDLTAAAFAPDGKLVVIGHISAMPSLPPTTTSHVLGDASGNASRTGFVARFSNDGKSLLSFTRFPWGSAELHRVAVNTNGIYITGFGNNRVNNIPGFNKAIDENTSTSFGDFVIRLNLTANACLSGTFLGGDDNTLSEKSKNRTGLALFSNGDVAVAHDRGATQTFDYLTRLTANLSTRVWHLWDNYINRTSFGSAKGDRLYTRDLALSADEQFLFTTGYIQGNTGLEPYKMPFIWKYRAMPDPAHIDSNKVVMAPNIRLLPKTNPDGTLNNQTETRYGFNTPNATYYGLYNFSFRLIGDNRMISDTTGLSLAPSSDGGMLATLYSDGGASVLTHNPNFPGFTLNGPDALPASIIGGDSWAGLGGATSLSVVGRLLPDTSNWLRLQRIRGTEDNVGAVNPFNRIHALLEMMNGKILAVGEGRDVADLEEWEYGSGAGGLIMKIQADASGNRRDFVTHVPGVQIFQGAARQGTRYAVVGRAVAGAPLIHPVQPVFGGGTDGYLVVFDDNDQPSNNIAMVPADQDAHVTHSAPGQNFGTLDFVSAQARTTYNGSSTHTAQNAKAYFRFDLSQVNRIITDVRLQFWLLNKYGQGQFEVWGVNEGLDNWSETTITYNNAPANTPLSNTNNDVWGVDATKAIKLGDWNITNGQTERLISFRSQALVDFIQNAATQGDRLATIILVKTAVQIDALNVASRNRVLSGDEIAPRLRLSLGPAAPDPYTAWVASFTTWPSGADTSPAGDPDCDGQTNLHEFALGTNPTSALSKTVPKVETTLVGGSQRLRMGFTPAQTANLRYFIQSSSNLQDWTDVLEITSQLTAGQPFLFTDTVNISSQSRRFLRLRITYSP